MRKTISMIRKIDFAFENSQIKVVANRSCSAIDLGGLSVGPFEEGNEYETYEWVAYELEKSGIVHLHEENNLNSARLNKIQWTERVQTPGQISKLPDDFYPKVRRCIAQAKKDAAKSPEQMSEYEKARHLARDVVNSRLKKIVSMASGPGQTEPILKNLVGEERFLYERLYKLISEWREKILQFEEAVE